MHALSLLKKKKSKKKKCKDKEMSILTEFEGVILTLSTLPVPGILTNVFLDMTGKIVICKRKRTCPSMTSTA